jgi:hypothetical protein
VGVEFAHGKRGVGWLLMVGSLVWFGWLGLGDWGGGVSRGWEGVGMDEGMDGWRVRAYC